MTKKLTILSLLTIVSVVIISAIGLYYPYINLKEATKKDWNYGYDYEIVVTKFDLFSPRLSTVIPVGDEGYWVVVADYKRDSIFTFKQDGLNGKTLPNGFDSITARIEPNVSLNKAQEIAREYDLSEVNPDNTIVNNGRKLINEEQKKSQERVLEARKEENFYFDYINLEELTDNREKLKIEDFLFIQQGDKLGVIFDKIGRADRGTTSRSNDTATQMPEANYKINSKNVNFVAVGFEKNNPLSINSDLTDTVQKIVLVMNNREFIEVPVREDGSFDFESVREYWE